MKRMNGVAGEPRRWTFLRRCWIGILAALVIAMVVTLFRVRESKVSQFYKVKESRRGEIRKAKEAKKDLMFTQKRKGVTRNVWMQDPLGPRRQFFLEADGAEACTSVAVKGVALKELFSRPRGWLQEDLFWEVSSTGERVVKRRDCWVKETPPHQPIPEQLYRKVKAVQRARFFDAVTAEWDPETNRLVAHKAFFSVVKIEGHELPSSPEMGTVLARGTAQSLTFSFDKNGKQQVTCQGVRLHLTQEKPA